MSRSLLPPPEVRKLELPAEGAYGGESVPPKKHIIIIAVLSMISLGLGYWYGMPKEGSSKPETPKEPEFLRKGLVAYYPFNGNAEDESWKGNDGVVNGATLTTDRHGERARAYSFDGNDDLIEIPPNQSINAMRALSIAFWIKANKAQNPKGKYGYTGLVTRWSFEDKICAFGIWIIGERIAICAWPIDQADQFMAFDKEVWKHIVYTHGVSDSSIYVDGERKTRKQFSINLRESSIPLIIGADNESSRGKYRFFSGQLDDIRIYNRALTEAEVKALYEFEKPKTQQTSKATFTSDPNNADNVKIEAAIRKAADKPTGKLTKVDFEKVTSLDLRFNQLTNVKELEKLTQLTLLDLYKNQLTSVKGLEKLTQLEGLTLSNNKLTDVKGLEKLTQLKQLRLDGNQLTSVKCLEKFTQLTLLHLDNNPYLTKAQIDQLQKALTNCKIRHNATK